MKSPAVLTQDEWLIASTAVLVEEKNITHPRDEAAVIYHTYPALCRNDELLLGAYNHHE